MKDEETIRSQFKTAGQDQVFRFWEELSGEGREHLLNQASQIDLVEVADLVKTHLQGGHGDAAIDSGDLEPAPYIPIPVNGDFRSEWMEATKVGVQVLHEGRVAAFTVAGGQGTRLGYDGPKGTFPVTPVRGKTLFQVFAEKIRGSQEAFGAEIPWYLMTSQINDEQTRQFLAEHHYFGLNPDQVYLFQQGLMPAVDAEGKIMLEQPDCIAMSPDGHGGSLRALYRSGALEDMERRGIDLLSYFQVDNPMVQAIDPAFIGFHVGRGSDLSSKMTPKAYAEEKVGVFCVKDGRTVVVEYSDLPEELMQAKDSNDNLRFAAGSIAIHILSRSFVEKTGSGVDENYRLPFHRAHKKVTTVDDKGNPVQPAAPNGYKFEMFVFDALPFAREPVVVECRREDEFSPVKNAEGQDSPETCRQAQLRQAAAWLRAAGEAIAVDDQGIPSINLEISPLFAQSEQEFVLRWKRLSPKPTLTDGLVLE